jgi:ketosteroid isomerase-like protein
MTIADDLRSINAGFSAAMAAPDVDAVVAFYTDDARILFPGVPEIRGRDAIHAAFRDDLGGGPQEIRFESAQIFDGDPIVVDVGAFFTPRGEGKYVVVYERQPDGTLKIAVDAASSNGPPRSDTAGAG